MTIVTLKDQILTPPAVAEHLGVTVDYLAQLRHRGEGPAYIKRAATIRYRVQDVEKWLNDGYVVPQTWEEITRPVPAA